MVDFLAAEGAILARLEEMVPGVRILSAADLAGIKAGRQVTPAIYLLLDNIRPESSAARGRALRIRQRWAVVVTVRNVREIKSGAGARQEAGPMITQCIQALSGWTPAEGHTPLLLAETNMRPGYQEGDSPGLPSFLKHNSQ